MTIQLGQITPASNKTVPPANSACTNTWGAIGGFCSVTPKDFTLVCTTEPAEVARLMPEWDKRHVEPIGLTVGSGENHPNRARDNGRSRGLCAGWPAKLCVSVAARARRVGNSAASVSPYYFPVARLCSAMRLVADRDGRCSGVPIRFALSAFVVARETNAQAEEELRYLVSLAQQDAPLRRAMAGRTDPKAVMFRTFARNPAFGSNGGTAAGLVGSYDTVADRIQHFADPGIETFMPQFQPCEAEMRRFAQEVRPRVDRLAKAAA